MSTVLILGANGHFGRATTLAFAAAGWQVRAHLRRAPRGPLPAGVAVVQADALDLAALASAAEGCELIVNGLNPDYTRWASLLPPITAATVALAERSGATLLMPGNVYNFGHALPAVLREDTPFVPDHPKAAQRIALEATLAEAARARGVRSIVLRAGDFLGDAGTWLDLGMGRALPCGRFLQMGPADLPHAWAWLPDLARTAVAVAERRAALPAPAVLHAEGLTLTGAGFQRAFDAAWQARGGAPLTEGRFPWWLLQIGAALPGRPGAMPRALLEMRHLWQRPHRLAEDRLAALIGPVPHTPLAEVMRACIDALPPGLRAGLDAGARPAAASLGS